MKIVGMNIIKLIIILITLEGLFASSVYAKTENGKTLTVGITPLARLLSTAKHSAPANIISLNHSIISAEITGRALKILVETGNYVKQGQKLVELDCRSYILAKKQAKAGLRLTITQLNYAKKQFVRNQRLLKQGTIPRELYDKAEAAQLTELADIELKKTTIEATDLTIQRCQIKAPFSGQITKRMVQKGQLVTPGTPLLQLMQNNHREIKATLSPEELINLKEAKKISFSVGKKHYKSSIRSIIQNVDELTRTLEVRLRLPKGAKLAAGLSGRIQWNGNNRQLPAEFVIRRNNQLGVMIAEDIVEGIGKARYVPLPNAKEGQPVSITLPSSSAIITNNRYRVKDAELIKVQVPVAPIK